MRGNIFRQILWLFCRKSPWNQVECFLRFFFVAMKKQKNQSVQILSVCLAFCHNGLRDLFFYLVAFVHAYVVCRKCGTYMCLAYVLLIESKQKKQQYEQQYTISESTRSGNKKSGKDVNLLHFSLALRFTSYVFFFLSRSIFAAVIVVSQFSPPIGVAATIAHTDHTLHGTKSIWTISFASAYMNVCLDSRNLQFSFV